MSQTRLSWSLATVLALQGCTVQQQTPAASELESVPIDQFAELNAVRLHYLDWGGQGDLLLLLPGLTATAHHFDDLAPLLRADFRVVALTRRAHGASDRPGVGYDLETLASDVSQFLDYLSAERVVLVAHSFASLEAVEVAKRQPARVTALVLLDAAYDWPVWLDQPAHLSAVEPPDRALDSFEQLETWYREVQSPTWGRARQLNLRSQFEEGPNGRLTPRLPADAVAAMLKVARQWTPESFEGLRAPTLVVWANQRQWEFTLRRLGEPDSVVAAQRAWREQVDIPAKMRAIDALRSVVDSVRIVEIDAVHELHLQRPGEVASAMREFLAGVER